MAKTVAVAGTQLRLARITGVALRATTHVVDALTNRERTVLLAEGDLAAQATVASLAQADAAGALAIAAASRRAKLGAARATVSSVAGALTLLALAMAIAHLRASLHRAVTTIKALEARASCVDAHATERAVVHAGCDATVNTGEAGATEACALLADTVAVASIRASRPAAVIARVAFGASALEARAILNRSVT